MRWQKLRIEKRDRDRGDWDRRDTKRGHDGVGLGATKRCKTELDKKGQSVAKQSRARRVVTRLGREGGGEHEVVGLGETGSDVTRSDKT